MNTPDADLDRLCVYYADRERRLAGSDLYSFLNPAHMFLIQQRQRAVVKLLLRHSLNPLGNRQILELGCGQGGVLLEYLSYGAAPERLHGVDLLPGRVMEAHARLPHLALTCADGQHLPYKSGAFDLVLQYTVFSSVLDDAIKVNLACEMLRVLKLDGLILWYDFWLNPINPQTKGIHPREVNALFPNCHCEFHRITLAPPIARRLVKWSWGACLLLAWLRLFNTHYLAAIQPKDGRLQKEGRE
jgi:ubiquinone/menaquinone biosynthesis C-methylase UbiE